MKLEMAFWFLSPNTPMMVSALLGKRLRVKNMSLSTCYFYILGEILLVISLQLVVHR